MEHFVIDHITLKSYSNFCHVSNNSGCFQKIAGLNDLDGCAAYFSLARVK